jgi:ureidoacrylate peracid hydrolase
MLVGVKNKVRPEHTALVVIDYQNEFCDEEGVFAKAGFDVSPLRAIEGRLVALIDAARKAGIALVWVRCTYSTPGNLYLSPVFMEHALRCWNGRYSEIPVCAEGSWGQQFYGRVHPEPGEAVISKHRYDAFVGTDLDVVLRAKAVQTMVVCGVATNICVETTVRHAFCLDYYAIVPTDAVAAWDQTAHDVALAGIRYAYGELSTVDEIIKCWR